MLLLFMIVGLGSAWAEDVCYSLTFSKLTTGTNYNSYTAFHTFTSGDIEWDLYGNQSIGDNIRVGGKNATATNRTLTSKGKIKNTISKIIIKHSGIGNGKNSQITINSIKVEGSTSQTFENGKSKEMSSPSVSSAGELEFVLENDEIWDENSYYRITVNYVIEGANNCYITINSIDFYSDDITPETPTTYNINIDDKVAGGTISANPTTATEGTEVTLTATPSEGYEFTSWSVLDGDAEEITVTGNKFTMPASDVEVSATFTKVPDEEDAYYAVVSLFNDSYYAMKDAALTDKILAAEKVNVVNNKVVNCQSVDDISWLLTDKNIVSKKGNYIKATTSGTNVSLIASKQTGIFEYDTDKNCWKDGIRTFIYAGDINGFKNYAISNAKSSGYGSIGYLMTFSDGYVRPNLEEGKIGTICLDHTIEDVANISGAKFYSIAGKRLDAEGNPTSLVLEEETEGLLGGYPYIFIASATDIVIAYEGDADATSAENNNGLYGSLEDMDVAEGMYLVSGNKIQKCGTGCSIAANRAYINMEEVPEYNATPSAKTFTIAFDYATSINGVSIENSASVYSLTGIRVNSSKLERGIYINNGKKMFVK